MNRIDTPEFRALCPLTHVVRYMSDGLAPLSYADANATDDFPDVSDDRFFQSRRDLVLQIRSGRIDLFSNIVMADQRHPLLEGELTPTARASAWSEFLAPYRKLLSNEESGLLDVHPPQPIPTEIVEERLLHWERGVLHFREKEVICFCMPLMVPLAQISLVTAGDFVSTICQQEKPSPAKLPTSVAKLIVGMAIGGYGYRTDQKRNEAISDIINDLDLHGLSLDRKTVLKWLSLSVSIAPPTDHVS